MKSITSVLAVLGAAGILFAQGGCSDTEKLPAVENAAPAAQTPAPAPAPSGTTAGNVLETMDSGGYTYVLLETDQGQLWAAGPQTAITVGDALEISQGMAMTQFHSTTLDRTFDVLYFVNAFPQAAEPVDISVAALEPGQDIAWVYANTESVANQAVSLRGEVVKYNSNILGWNFFHIQDGSGDAADGNNDLTVTSKATTAVGETVVVTGTVILNKDFGSGYRFPVLMEDASIAN